MLWEGRPDGGIRFRPMDLFLIPFSFIWAGGALSALGAGIRAPGLGTGIGLLFGVIAIYITVGRFFHDAYLRSRTRYALTDRRALVASGMFSKNLQSIPIEKSTPVSLSLGKRSTISFTNKGNGFFNQMQQNPFFGTSDSAFDYIADGPAVFAMIQELQERHNP